MNFITPVHMKVTKEQYKSDIELEMLNNGYEMQMEYLEGYLVTNYNKNNNFFGFTTFPQEFNGYKIDHYNPQLFLALAAMTDQKFGIQGEWWKCIRTNNNSCFFVNAYYKATHEIDKLKAFTNDIGNPDGHSLNPLLFFIKATKEELIEHIAITHNIDRNISIKCANQQEFYATLDFLQSKGEVVSNYCFYQNGEYPIIKFLTNKWTSLAQSFNSKTPQELNIIPILPLTILPEYWAVENSKIISEIFDDILETSCYKNNQIKYLHSHNRNNQKLEKNSERSFGSDTKYDDYIIITEQQFLKYYKKPIIEKQNFIITPKQAQEIINQATYQWKKTLAKQWSSLIVLKHNIFVTKKFYDEMKLDSTPSQHILFDQIFEKKITITKNWIETNLIIDKYMKIDPEIIPSVIYEDNSYLLKFQNIN